MSISNFRHLQPKITFVSEGGKKMRGSLFITALLSTTLQAQLLPDEECYVLLKVRE